MKKASRPRWIAWAAAVPIALFAAVELGVRAFVTQDALVYRDTIGPGPAFELKPGARGIKSGVLVEINAEGLRDRDVPRPKPSDEFRVVVVGDHAAFGLGVPVEEAYSRLLESKVPAPRGKRLRTVNLAMYSYTLPMKVQALRQRGPGLEPDFVVFEVNPRDVKQLPRVVFKNARLKNWVRDHCQSCRLASERLFWRRSPPASSGTGPPLIESQLRGLQETLSNELKTPVLVVFCPDLSASGLAAENAENTRRGYRDAARKLGLDFYDLSAELRRRPAAEMLKNPADPWLSPAAHRLAADGVAREVRRVLQRRAAAQRPRA